MIPVSDRDSRVGRHRHGGCDPRHDLKGNPCLLEDFQLLSASSEHERITALQAQHPLSLLCLPNKDMVDLFLGNRVVPRMLSHIDGLFFRRNAT